MLYAIVIDGIVTAVGTLLELYPSRTFAVAGPDAEIIQELNLYTVSTTKPHDEVVEKLIQTEPYLEGSIVYTVSVVNKTEQEINDYITVQDLKVQAKIDENLAKLWEAADRYQYQYINGLAVGLLTIGLANSLPKAKAIAAWADEVWNGLYYPRKALVTEVYDPSLYDFSEAGPIPHTIPELDAEVKAFLQTLNP